MNAIQLELNLENETEIEVEMGYMKKQIADMHESMGKVRRRLFSELGELKNICLSLQRENHELKNAIGEMKHEKTKWIYGKGDCLFDVQKPEGARD